jgi:hypothetical protein
MIGEGSPNQSADPLFDPVELEKYGLDPNPANLTPEERAEWIGTTPPFGTETVSASYKDDAFEFGSPPTSPTNANP